MSSIAVIIPCYNAEQYLAEALESVREQERPPEEIVVVDDASTDGSVAIARRFGLRVLQLERNGGASRARNQAVRYVDSDMVAMLDADDVWHPDHLATVGGLLDRFPDAGVAFGLVQMFGSQRWVWPALLPEGVPTDATSACLARCTVLPTSAVFRRSLFLQAGGFDEELRLAEDYDLWLRLSLLTPFVCTHRITSRRRMHAAQTSGDQQQYWSGEYLSRRKLLERAQATAPPEEVERLAAAMCDVWADHLLSAWHSRRSEDLRFHLRQWRHMPGTTDVRRTWEWWARTAPALELWDALPLGLRRAVRRFLPSRTAVSDPQHGGADTPARASH